MVKILIVEDEEAIRSSLIDMLELADHEVIVANDGDIGLKRAQENIPDLIISDIMMPNMDGYALFEAIKSDLTTAHIPFIFLTALASYDNVREGMNLGADDYLTKPFNYKQLMTAVNARLNKHAREEQTRLRQFAQRLVDLQEHERTQLARDLETDIQEPLNGLSMMVNLAEQTKDLSVLKTVKQIAEELVNRSQSLSLRLVPTMIEHLNIISVLVWLFEDYKTKHKLKIDFERAGYLPQFSLKEKIAIYRIVDEALRNTVSHSDTQHVSIRISVREDVFFADIRDDGVGFDVQQGMNGATTGLQSMFERAMLLGGDLNIHSILNDGTQITLELPVAVVSDEDRNKITPQKTLEPSQKPTSISKIRLLIADDHDIIRHGLQQIISHDKNLNVVAHASSRQELLQQLRQHEVEVIILDLGIDGASSFDLIKVLGQQQPHIRIIAFSTQKQEIYAVEAIKSGASGYLLKDSSSIEVIDAIHKVARGEQYIGEALADKVFDWILNSRSTTGTVTNIYDLLTEREREILLLAITGLTSAEIAEELMISPRTVEKHRSNFMSKLGLKTPTQLMKFASDNGLIA